MGSLITGAKGKQDYATPWALIKAVERRFGPLAIDLAASLENKKAPLCYTEDEDSLSADWGSLHGLNCWLNPPFKNIGKWAEKAERAASKGLVKIFMLTPASVGSNWYSDFVHQKARVYALKPRITFEGAKDPFPKDCMLTCFGYSWRFDVWDWSVLSDYRETHY